MLCLATPWLTPCGGTSRRRAEMSKTPKKNWVKPAASGWDELWLKEDWWAIWLGIGIICIAYILFANGGSLSWLAVTPAKWSNLAQLGRRFAANFDPYLAQLIVSLAACTAPTA